MVQQPITTVPKGTTENRNPFYSYPHAKVTLMNYPEIQTA